MQLRWGICGSGKICKDFVTALRLLPEVEHAVAAVAASNAERARVFARENNVSLALESYDDLMKCPQIDIIYVGVVNAFHKHMVLNALNNGKHVLCEKPLGVNAAEVKEMVHLAREKKLFLMEGYWTRFFPAFNYMRTEIDKGVIGEPKLVVANFGFPLHAEVLSKETASGTLLGIGCYCIMLSTMVFKEKPTKILASGFLNKYEVITPNGHKVFPLPDHSPDIKFNYPHSEGLSYEAQYVRECIVAGKTECDIMTLDESISQAEVNDDVRRQLGVRYAQDDTL